MKKIFPTVLIILQALDGVVCLAEKDFKMSVY